ncbi:MAG TPA: hypothetical protein VFK73_09865, partial [Paludibacter sp.]|nr:hypothetical protein [Paludibacter sp.]
LSVSNITNTYYTLAGLNSDKEYKISIRAINTKNLVKIISLNIRTMKELISEIYQIRFGKYEYSKYDFVRCIKTTDNGYVFFGEAEKIGNGCKLILKTDENYNIIWKQEILDGLGFHYIISYDQNVEECKNGDILILVEKAIYRLTSTGELLWKIDKLNNSSLENIQYVTEMPDGNYLAVGTSSEIKSTNFYSRFMAIKFTKEGTVIWKNIFGTTYYNYGYFAITNNDGSFLFIGNADTSGATSDNYSNSKCGLSVESMSANGDFLNENIFSYNGTASPRYALPTSDGGYYFVCTGSYVYYAYTSESYIIKTKKDGTFLWERRGSEDGEYYASPKAATVLQDNSLLVVSYLDYDNYGIKEFSDDGKLKSTFVLKNYPSPILIDKDKKGRYVYITKEGYIIKINPDGYVNL